MASKRKHAISVSAKTFARLDAARAATGATIASIVEVAVEHMPEMQHEHGWEPAVGSVARYVCSAGPDPCGATGYRDSRGKIVKHKVKPRIEPEVTARARNPAGGRLGFAPLDDFEPPKERE